MLSLDNSYNLDELRAFDQRCQTLAGWTKSGLRGGVEDRRAIAVAALRRSNSQARRTRATGALARM